MTYYSDLETSCQIACGQHIRSVGWLSREHPYPTGNVPSPLVEKLQQFRSLASLSAMALYWPFAGGGHLCEFCGQEQDGLNFGVPTADLLYACPALCAHYVEAHAYLPPAEFLSALAKSALPGSYEYDLSAAPFNEVLRPKHRDVHALVASLKRDLGAPDLTYFSPVSADEYTIMVADDNIENPQMLVWIRVARGLAQLELVLGEAPFRQPDTFHPRRTWSRAR